MNVCSSVSVRVSTFCSVVVIFVVTFFIITSNVGYFGAVCVVPMICFKCFHESVCVNVFYQFKFIAFVFPVFVIFYFY